MGGGSVGTLKVTVGGERDLPKLRLKNQGFVNGTRNECRRVGGEFPEEPMPRLTDVLSNKTRKTPIVGLGEGTVMYSLLLTSPL